MFYGYYTSYPSSAKMYFSYIRAGKVVTEQVTPTTATVGQMDIRVYEIEFDVLLSAWIDFRPPSTLWQSAPMKVAIGTGQASNFQMIEDLGLFTNPVVFSGINNIKYSASVDAEIFGSFSMDATAISSTKQYFNLNMNCACGIKRIYGTINFPNTGTGVILKTYSLVSTTAEMLCSRSVFDVTATGYFGFNLTTSKVGLVASTRGISDNFAGYIRADTQNLYIELENFPTGAAFGLSKCDILTIPF